MICPTCNQEAKGPLMGECGACYHRPRFPKGNDFEQRRRDALKELISSFEQNPSLTRAEALRVLDELIEDEIQRIASLTPIFSVVEHKRSG